MPHLTPPRPTPQVCILTFDGPFITTSNGYFGSWFATMCTASFAYQSFIHRPLHVMQRVRTSFSFNPAADDAPAGRPAPQAV